MSDRQSSGEPQIPGEFHRPASPIHAAAEDSLPVLDRPVSVSSPRSALGFDQPPAIGIRQPGARCLGLAAILVNSLDVPGRKFIPALAKPSQSTPVGRTAL